MHMKSSFVHLVTIFPGGVSWCNALRLEVPGCLLLGQGGRVLMIVFQKSASFQNSRFQDAITSGSMPGIAWYLGFYFEFCLVRNQNETQNETQKESR